MSFALFINYFKPDYRILPGNGKIRYHLKKAKYEKKVAGTFLRKWKIYL